MNRIDEVRLARHRDPRLRAAAVQASRLRADLWRTVLRASTRGLMIAAAWIGRAATRRVAGPARHRAGGTRRSLTTRLGGCQ